MNRIQNKNIIIFGATGLIGKHLTSSLASKGANLIVHGRSNEKLKILSGQIPNEFKKPVFLESDIMSENFYMDILKIVSLKFKHIDIMINLVSRFDGLKPIMDLSHKEWNELMEINFNSHWRILKELNPLLGKTSKSKVIFLNNQSIQHGKAYHNSLSISMGALNSLVQTLNLEKKKIGVEFFLVESKELFAGATELLGGRKKFTKKDLDFTINNIIKKCSAY